MDSSNHYPLCPYQAAMNCQINDNIYIYDEINDLDLDEMDTTNNLNHELTSGASIIDIDDMGYEMPSKWMTVDENINDSVRNSPTLTEDDNSLQLDSHLNQGR
jgi:hypothetical protein